MSKIKIVGHASGSGVLTIAAPNTNTDRTITIPDVTGTLLDSGSALPAANLTGTVVDARISALTASKLTGALPAISGANLTGISSVTALGGLTDATTSGTYNIGLGTNTLAANVSGQDNIAVGYNALAANTTASTCTAVGKFALAANTTGDSNTAVGREAMQDNTTGATNTAFGLIALGNNTTASNNTAIGSSAMAANTTGAGNTAVGKDALKANTTAVNNTAVGIDALEANTTGASNSAVGRLALGLNTTGLDNVAFGRNTLHQNTTGSYNTGLGSVALNSNTTGASNTAVGYYAMVLNTTGAGNVAVGKDSMDSNTSGSNNAAFGECSLQNNSTGGFNTAIGKSSLSGTTGTSNTAIGGYALLNVAAADDNVAVGRSAGQELTTGNRNVLIGKDAGMSLTTADDCIIIGCDVDQFGSNTAHDQLNIGNVIYGTGLASGSTPSSSGKVGIGVGSPSAKLDLGNTASNTVGGTETLRIGEAAFRVMTGGEQHVMCLDRDNAGGTKKIMMAWNPDTGSVSIGNTGPVARGFLSIKPLDINQAQLKLMGANYGYGCEIMHQNGSESGTVGNTRGWSKWDIYTLGSTRRFWTAASQVGTDYQYWSTNNAERFRIAHNGDLTATDTSIGSNSDERVKENINNFTYDLVKFKQLTPRTFDWKNPDDHNSKSNNRGFIAQEIEAVDDYWIGGVPINPNSADYDLIPEDSNDGICSIDEHNNKTDCENAGGTWDGEHISLTSKLGQKDAMYVSVINQLLEKIETLETKVTTLENA